jgi:hypothetical protein
MALKKKISKADYEKLAAHFKTEYKADGDDYVLDLDGEEDIGALQRANERNKAEAKENKRLLKEANDKLEAIEEKENKEKGNVTAIENSWKTKLETAKAESEAAVNKYKATLTKSLVDNVASNLAGELSTKAPKLLIPHIKARLAANFDGDEPTTRILDAAGKSSALTIEDLKKEFIDNPDFSAIITGSKATGGAGSEKNKGGAQNAETKPVIFANLPPKELAQHIKDKKANT